MILDTVLLAEIKNRYLQIVKNELAEMYPGISTPDTLNELYKWLITKKTEMKKHFLVVLLPVLYSCSTLKVNVSTADPDTLKIMANKIDPFEKLAFQYKTAFLTV